MTPSARETMTSSPATLASETSGSRALTILYATDIFVSAFLLFLIQPIAAKTILPWFGGSSAVWNTCLLFFQVFLLLGYLYSHCLHSYVRWRWQVWIHVALLGASGVLIGARAHISRIAGNGDPAGMVLATLALSIGLPYFLLSTTSPLLQAWYGASGTRGTPYRLYALSNLASVAALLAYPFLIEPRVSTGLQFRVWVGLYIVFAILTMAITRHPSRTEPQPAPEQEQIEECRPSVMDRILWVVLPACASVLLLAVTSALTQDIAPVPLLWVLPLAAYLLTFIVAFEAPRLYFRAVFLPLAVCALAVFGYLLWHLADPLAKLKLVRTTAIVVSSLFVFCMVCHGELVRLRPAVRHLTSFYLSLALGGALGGVFVGLVAPRVFSTMLELPIGLSLCLLLIVISLLRGYRAFFAPAAGKVVAALLGVVVIGYAALLGFGMRQSVPRVGSGDAKLLRKLAHHRQR